SSISGRVLSIRDYLHPILGYAKAVIIESDGQDTKEKLETRSQKEIEKLGPEEIRKLVQKAGIVGLGGAAFPTHIKLNPPRPIDTLIINGAECEPYLTSDYRLMVEKTKEIILGIDLVLRCINAKYVYIAIEDNKPEAIKAFKGEVKNLKFKIQILKSFYPQGGEKQLIKNILDKEVPSGKLPFDIGVVVHNVATIYAIYEAVYKNKPLYERIVTVTGSCLENPKNLLVRIGTPIKDLINACGPLVKTPYKIVMGGPMMGIAQCSQDIPIIKATNGIILLSEEEARIYEEQVCIRCGACVRNCPIGLMPCIIDAASRKQDWKLAAAYGALDCIECGLCSYVCPANRWLVEAIKLAKQMQRK
ncbi:MAG: electron transport complex subunit RsxC, partial [Candidatus Omnitrophica bacterium]|nr:electron transport complex subunit RsxC [Candidatus Omnitrophota bacterium]